MIPINLKNEFSLPKIKFDGEAFSSLKMQFADQILKQSFVNPKLNKQFDDCSIIYHYTSLTSLTNIIENQSLYFTNLFYLNDKLELKYGIELIKKVLADTKTENDSILNLVEDHIQSRINSDRFVFCFSLKGDLLSQWRAYANNGCGVSIGFKNHQLKNCLGVRIQQTHIDYDEEFQFGKFKEIIQQLIEFFESYKEIFDYDQLKYDEQVAIAIIEFCEALIDSLKHPAFLEEKEYRFTHVYNKKQEKIKIKLRLKENSLIPFIEIPTKAKQYYKEKANGKWDDAGADPTFVIDKLPIQKIILGPCLEEKTVIPSLKLLLSKNGYNDVEIIKSNIPYRI